MRIDPATEARLVEAARGAMGRAYAPYSRFRVGAALLCDDGTPEGRIVTGCNVENASYPASLCAERAAVGAAIALGLDRFRAVAVATEAEAPSSPCGICRQVLAEFAPAMPVVSATASGALHRWTMDELLPAPFVPDSLARG
ncbi:MAG TPA: cytidine deaminase [Gemmatimonadaceae bacterium]|nr:cytidine deaminase [Gemmatimonadaceae bacterium]